MVKPTRTVFCCLHSVSHSKMARALSLEGNWHESKLGCPIFASYFFASKRNKAKQKPFRVYGNDKIASCHYAVSSLLLHCHHPSSFLIIPHHSSPFPTIHQHPSSFLIIPHHPTPSLTIPYLSSYFLIIP